MINQSQLWSHGKLRLPIQSLLPYTVTLLTVTKHNLAAIKLM